MPSTLVALMMTSAFIWIPAQHGGRIRGEVRIARAAGEDHDASLVEMSLRAAANVRLRDLFHADRRHHARVDVLLLEHVLHRERVDHGAEHAHVVGADAIHPHFRELRAAHDVAAADHDTDARPHRDDVLDLPSEAIEDVEIETGGALSGECFTGELEQHARILERRATPAITPAPAESGRSASRRCSRRPWPRAPSRDRRSSSCRRGRTPATCSVCCL